MYESELRGQSLYLQAHSFTCIGMSVCLLVCVCVCVCVCSCAIYYPLWCSNHFLPHPIAIFPAFCYDPHIVSQAEAADVQDHRMATLRERYQAAMVLSGTGDALAYKNGKWEFCHSGKTIHDELTSLGGLKAVQVKREDLLLRLYLEANSWWACFA